MSDFVSAMAHFHFLRPWFLLALPIGLCLVWGIWRHNKSSGWQAFISPVLFSALRVRQDNTSFFSPIRLAVMMLMLWVCALAGPTWQHQASPQADSKAPLVIALHLSKSLLEQDLLPNRLSHVKQKVIRLLEQRTGAPTALLVYGASAHSVLPLTKDISIIKLYLQDLAPTVLPKVGSRPDLALRKAGELIKQNAGSVILVSDHYPSFQPSESAINALPIGTNVSALFISSNASQRLNQPSAITTVAMTVDDSDVRQLLSRVDQHWQNQLSVSGDLQWLDTGYYLLWPLLLLYVFWFRKGMVLQA